MFLRIDMHKNKCSYIDWAGLYIDICRYTHWPQKEPDNGGNLGGGNNFCSLLNGPTNLEINFVFFVDWQKNFDFFFFFFFFFLIL